MEVSFTGGGNWNTWRKPQTCHKSLTKLMFYWVHLIWAGFELKTLLEIDTDCIGSCKSNYCTIIGSCKSNECTIITTTAPCNLQKSIWEWSLCWLTIFSLFVNFQNVPELQDTLIDVTMNHCSQMQVKIPKVWLSFENDILR